MKTLELQTDVEGHPPDAVVSPTGVVSLMPDGHSNRTAARQLIGSELRDGYTVCACGKYVHIFRAEVLRRLPDGYDGELCVECHLWMCALDKLQSASRPNRFTNIGSNQDPDDYRNQSVDREREKEEPLKMPKPFVVTEATMLQILMPDKPIKL